MPEDAAVVRSVRMQEPVVTAFPQSPAALAYRALAAKLWRTVPSVPPSESIDFTSLRLGA